MYEAEELGGSCCCPCVCGVLGPADLVGDDSREGLADRMAVGIFLFGLPMLLVELPLADGTPCRTLDVFFWSSPLLSLAAGGGSPPPLFADELISTVRQAAVGTVDGWLCSVATSGWARPGGAIDQYGAKLWDLIFLRFFFFPFSSPVVVEVWRCGGGR